MVKLVHITPNSTDIIAYAARFSTATQEEDINKQIELEEDNEKLVKKLIRRGHFACLEFADAMFEIKGSRSMLAQITRHRMFSYMVKSQRYVSEKDFQAICPISINRIGNAYDIYEQTIQCIERSYKDLIDLGIPKEDARFILPNACETHLVMKGNFRSWIEFFTLRCDKHAQWEIRSIAEEMREILKKETFVFKYLYGGKD